MARKPYIGVSLAPIAGVTDRATRNIAREHGCGMTYSELISSKGLEMHGKSTLEMLSHCADEPDLGIQLFGKELAAFEEATRMATELGPEEINLNLGCPAKKVFGHGSGVALTKDPLNLARILRGMRRATHLPFTVKLRAGTKHDNLNFLEVGRIAQEEGVDALMLHARTQRMGFKGKAHWPWIAALVEAMDIPVIGNGDVVDGATAVRMVRETGCHGVMIGRATYGNPWIFREVEAALRGEAIPSRPSYAERIEVLCRHIRYAVDDLGEHRGIRELRKQTGWYLKAMPRLKELRAVTNLLNDTDEVIRTIQEWGQGLPDENPFASPGRTPLPAAV